MNKHIYYNELRITIGEKCAENSHNQVIVSSQKDSGKKLKNAIDEFLKTGNTKNLFIEASDFEKVFEGLKEQFYFIEAAGGMIQKNDQYLFIKRLGKWDLPKGKLDKGETIKEAAVRECEEECAVKDLNIVKALPNTYHIYPYKNGFALKVTYWFHMQTNYNKELKPQTEENIEAVNWLTVNDIKSIVLKNTYITISELVKDFFKL